MYKIVQYPQISTYIQHILNVDEHFAYLEIGEFYIIQDKSFEFLLSSALLLDGIRGVYNTILDTLHFATTNITKFDLVKLEYLLNDYHIYQWN